MSFMQDDFSNEDEKLYRAVKPEGIFIKENGSISSAAFKSSNGCSVDRGDFRHDTDAASFMKLKLEGDVYKFKVGDCNTKDIFIQYDPQPDDKYHSNLFKNEKKERLTGGQCKYLANIATKVG